MSKLQDIEKSLISINEAVFQNVCDAFLFFTEKEFPELHRTGSQTGKQKTTKGTPDTYFTIKNGKYVLVEYTTREKRGNKKSFIAKIKSDINKCLNEKITGIKLKSIHKIIFCHNSSLTLKESESLIEYCKKKKIKLEFKDAGSIALGLHCRCPHIAKEFLGIEIDTGQVLLPKRFVKEYSNSGLATPLDNKFYHRVNEIKAISDSLSANPITVLTGSPGVGKSRLALSAIENFQKNCKDNFKVYCLSNKNANIHDDLRTYLKSDKNYIILIDDANRQLDHLLCLLGILREDRNGVLKIIITVRDYAIENIWEKCIEFDPKPIRINKLTDIELTEILKGEDFKILNPEYQRRILEIADGNPRLAIMAAKVAKEKNTLFALNDVSDLYDKYFNLSLRGTNVLSDKSLIKALGIISFFYSIDRSNVTFYDSLLNQFGLDRYKFNESIDELEKYEMLETSTDLSVVKVSEQVLSTYFFYRAFLKDKELNFSCILTNYFDSHFNRIKDTIIPANNTFGYENVYEQITPFLDDFWNKIKKDDVTAIKFLKLFWYYRSQDVFSFVLSKLESQKIIKKAIFEFKESEIKGSFETNKDQIINLLSHFYYYPQQEFLQSIQFSIEYVRRNPTVYFQFAKSLRDSLSFSYEDSKSSFYRQLEFVKFITSEENSEDKLIQRIFYDIVPYLMQTSFNITSSGRNRREITWYQYKVPLNKNISDFRETVWIFIKSGFQKANEFAYSFIVEFIERTIPESKEIGVFDCSFIIPIIENNFSENNFEHCYLVQTMINTYSKRGIEHEDFLSLKSKFNSKKYQNYLILSFNRLRDRDQFEFTNQDEYERLKNEEIAFNFTFSNLKEFSAIYKEFEDIFSWKYGKNSELRFTLDSIVIANFKKNENLGINILNEIIKSGNKTRYIPWKIFQELFSNCPKLKINSIYNCIIESEFEGKTYWLLNFYRLIPIDDVEKRHSNDLIATFKKCNHDLHYINEFSYLEKFLALNATIYCELLKTIIAKNNQHKVRFLLEHEFFKKHGAKFSNHLELLKTAYIQQHEIDSNFDYNCRELIAILKLDNGFLIEFLEYLNKGRNYINQRELQGISVIWELQLPEKIIESVFKVYLNRSIYIDKDHLINCLFKNLDDENRIKAIELLIKILSKWKKNTNVVRLVFNVIRHSFRDKLSEFIKKFLLINNDLSIFKKIDWSNNSFTGSAEVIWEDIKVKEYEAILNILNDIAGNGIKYLKHKMYLKEMIDGYKRQADIERKMQFMNKDW